MRDTAIANQVSAETCARRKVSKHPRRRGVDLRVASGLDAAIREVRAEVADDTRLDTYEAGDGSRPNDAAELTEPQVRYLAALRLRPSVGCAMRSARVRFANLKRWRESLGFRAGEQEAVELGKGVLFQAAWEAAVTGVLEPVFQGGLLVGHKRRFSERMRELLLKSLMPEVFDRKALQGQPPLKTIIFGSAEEIAEVVRRFSPTARRGMEHPHPNEGIAA